MHKVTINQQPYGLPSNWQEFPAGKIKHVISAVFSGKPTPHDRIAALVNLLPLPKKIWSSLSESQLYDLSQCLAWMYAEPMTVPPFSDFEIKGIKYYMPGAFLKFVGGYEYAQADAAFSRFIDPKRPDLKALDELVAILCRPAKLHVNVNDPDWDGDIREKFNDMICSRRKATMAAAPDEIKKGVLLYFAGCKRAIKNSPFYSVLYEGTEEDKAASKNFGIYGNFMDMAAEGMFGDFEKVSYTPIMTLLYWMVKRHHEIKKQEEQQRALQRNKY